MDGGRVSEEYRNRASGRAGQARPSARSSRTGQATRSSARQGQSSRSRTSSAARQPRSRASTPAARQRTTTATRSRSAQSAGSVLASLSPKAKLIGIGVIALILVIIIAAVAFAQKPADDSGAKSGASSQAGSQSSESASAEAVLTKKQPDGPFSITFASTGDIIFGREVGTYVDANGGASALANVADKLAAADVTIANVEAPLSDDTSEPIFDKDVYLISRPAGIESLKESDITMVSLANNHSMDYTGPALEDTLELLDGAGIKHAGAGMTEEEADRIVELEVNGASIAFISWTDVIPDNFLAYGDQPGVASARMNMDAALKKVAEARATHDIVIVAMHWGIEYEDYIDDYQQRTPAHQLVEAGADVIIGNHPHVIQGIEFYNGSLISYSQGDFVFDHYSQKTGETFILNFDVTEEGISNVTATPVYLDDTYGIPSIVTGEHAQSILERLSTISDGMNSSFSIVDDVAYITPIEK